MLNMKIYYFTGVTGDESHSSIKKENKAQTQLHVTITKK